MKRAMVKSYNIEAVWDDEAGVYIAVSDIPGLNIEAVTIDAFLEVVRDVAPVLIAANEPTTLAKPAPVHFKADLALA